MAAEGTSICKAATATLHLAPEALMTRAALSEETLASRYPGTRLHKGDPRLDRLTAALRDLDVRASTLPRFDPRVLVRIECEDGSKVAILASATQPDGVILLSINGTVVSSRSGFRQTVDSIANGS